MTTNRILRMLVSAACLALMTACSTTSRVPDDDKLFVGLTKIGYENYEKNDHFTTTQEEVEAALATAPNGALFGSSYYRTPFPYRLWIWNAFSGSHSVIGKWLTKSFGKAPVLMSRVNPALRAKVAQGLLRDRGYFGASVSYKEVAMSNPKKAKIAYTVDVGHLYNIDTLVYTGFPTDAMRLIDSTRTATLVPGGTPFDVSVLDAERNRLSTLFRNNGYYYYQPGYASYLADTLSSPGSASLRLQLADGIPDMARRQWYIGDVDLQIRKQYTDQLTDSFRYRHFSMQYNGRRPPMRARVIMKDVKLRHGQPYSYDNYIQSANKLSATGVFSMVDFKFTPRDTTALNDTIDLTLNCILDKPYDFYVESNVTGKTTGRVGPGLVLGITKRNAFRGGEKLDLNLKGSYEWQTGHRADGTSSKFNSYEYGIDASLELPRLLLPFWQRRRFYNTPSTLIKASSNVLNRSGYFKRHVVSGELTYSLQATATSRHQFSPLIIQYEYMKDCSEAFGEILNANPYLMLSMADQFVPMMRYTYTYSSPSTYRNPIYWQTTFSEAANVLSLGYMAAGKRWDDKGKKMFKNPYAQFLKVESDLRKTWQMGDHAQLVAHLNAGIIWSYGNSESAPYSEQFYVGGANSIRAFNVRSIGPGGYYTSESCLSYMDQTGDIKLLANIEYRPRLFGNLYGALFLDAGNVWALRDDGYRNASKLRFNKLLEQTALGTGIGIRYDLDFFVLRLDWGIGIHLPYKHGFYNMPSFGDSQSLHFAIGYPF